MQELLFLAHRIPYPPDKGDKIRSWNFLSYLAGRYRVRLGCFVDDARDWQHRSVLNEICAECHFVRLAPSIKKLRGAKALVTGEALTTAIYRDPSLANWVRDVLMQGNVGTVFIFSSAMAQYVLRADVPPTIRKIVDFVDVDSQKWRQYAVAGAGIATWMHRREARKLLEVERLIAAKFDACLFVSREEAELFRRLAPKTADKLIEVRNGVDAEYFSPERVYDDPFAGKPHALVFTGAMDYWPNVDAVVWFADEVLPQVLSAMPDARFYVLGDRAAAEVRALSGRPGITLLGHVPDVRPYLAHAAAVVAPLRIARGVQNKVLEGMAMARPVIATPAAVEGIKAEPGQEVLVAGESQSFADAVLSVLNSGEGEAVGGRARVRVEHDYDWSESNAQLASIIEGFSTALP